MPAVRASRSSHSCWNVKREGWNRLNAAKHAERVRALSRCGSDFVVMKKNLEGDAGPGGDLLIGIASHNLSLWPNLSEVGTLVDQSVQILKAGEPLQLEPFRFQLREHRLVHSQVLKRPCCLRFTWLCYGGDLKRKETAVLGCAGKKSPAASVPVGPNCNYRIFHVSVLGRP
eukprot:s690_g8.t1